jgi:hypothetical protein
MGNEDAGETAREGGGRSCLLLPFFHCSFRTGAALAAPYLFFSFQTGAAHAAPFSFHFFSSGGSTCCPRLLSFLFERGQRSPPPFRFISLRTGQHLLPPCLFFLFRTGTAHAAPRFVSLPPQQVGGFLFDGVYDGGQRGIHTLPFVLLRYPPNRRLRQGQRETHTLPLFLLCYPPIGVYDRGSVKSTRCLSFCFISPPTSGVFFSAAVTMDRGSVKPTRCPSFCFITPPTSGGFSFRRRLRRGAVWNPHAALRFASLPPEPAFTMPVFLLHYPLNKRGGSFPYYVPMYCIDIV